MTPERTITGVQSTPNPLHDKRIAALERLARTATFAAIGMFSLSAAALVAGAGSSPSTGPDASPLVIVPVMFFLGMLASGTLAWILRSEIRSARAIENAGGM